MNSAWTKQPVTRAEINTNKYFDPPPPKPLLDGAAARKIRKFHFGVKLLWENPSFHTDACGNVDTFRSTKDRAASSKHKIS